MDAILSKQIIETFRKNGNIVDEKLVPECVKLCTAFSLTAEDLLWKVEANNYSARNNLSEFTPVTMDTLGAIKKQLSQSQTKGTRTQMKSRQSQQAEVNLRAAPSTLKAAMAVKKEEPSTQRFLEAGSPSVTLIGPDMNRDAKKRRAYRYMYEKLIDRSEVLDQLIDDFADLIRNAYNVKELADPGETSEEEVIVVGRIARDLELTSTSRLDEGSIVIETSKLIGTGSRTPLVFDPALNIRGGVNGVGGFGIFPGAIVALKGKNGGGGYFLATEFISMPAFDFSPAAKGGLAPKLDASIETANIVVACGPFTSDADLTFRHWKNLMSSIKSSRPDVLILIGPLIDTAHPKIKAGDSDLPPNVMFRAHFSDPLNAFLTANPKSIVIVVPSVRDMMSDHAAYPQPELDGSVFGNHSRIHCFPNPCRFSINGVNFATTSIDVLFHLKKEEYFKRGVETTPLNPGPDDLPADTWANLTRHLLLQRSFYPIFPVPEDYSHEVNLDLSHSEHLSLISKDGSKYAPDVLILPCRLKQFSKMVHSTMTINPSYVSKGSYCTIKLQPESSGTPKDRLKVEILRIDSGPPAATSATPSA